MRIQFDLDSPVNCTGAGCPPVVCPAGQVLTIPKGECCGRCKVIDKCFGIPCALPLCFGNTRPIVPEGECCPKCLPDCSAVLCFKPECNKPGEVLITPPRECCPKCQQNCSAVSCLRPVCKPGEILVTPDGECCPKCQLDCSLVDCALPVCTSGERVVVPEGECCPVCVRDPTCAAASCVIPVCPAGQVAKVPEGECCPVCMCEVEGQTFSQCASACPRTCESPDIFCIALCRPGCRCPPNQVIDTMNKRCVPLEECPERKFTSIATTIGCNACSMVSMNPRFCSHEAPTIICHLCAFGLQ